jgi:phospholipase C
MPFNIKHSLVSENLRCKLEKNTVNETVTVKCSESGKFRVLFPGPLSVGARVTYRVVVRVDPIEIERPRPLKGKRKKVESRTENLPLTIRIESPDGKEFTAKEVTLQDLARFRDLQGVTRGFWTYKVTGQSRVIPVGDGDSVTRPTGTLSISLMETLASQSGAPLVNSRITAAGTRQFGFDLHRLGRLTVSVRSRVPLLASQRWRGKLILRDPNGATVATSQSERLTFDVTLPVLDRSRGSLGEVRQWTLEVQTTSPGNGGSQITANVITTARLNVSLLNDRLRAILGENGANVSIFGENSGGRAKVQLKIHDLVAAESIDMHGLLDDVIGGGEPDIETGVAYTLASEDESMKVGRLNVSEMRVSGISVSVGASQRIQPPVPAIRLKVTTQGKLKAEVGGITLATASLEGGSLDIEAGFRLEANGNFVPATAFPEKVVDVDISKAAFAAAVLTTGGLGALGAAGFIELVERKVNALIRDGMSRAVASIIARVPRVLAIFTGADFTYSSVRLEGNDILFDYLAPDEPALTPAKNYTGVVGRSVTQLGPAAIRINPPLLGDTWARGNLVNKIRNIVVIMMENRSFDHVLGHLAQAPNNGASDGLSQELLTAMAAELVKAGLATATDTIPKLNQSAFQIKTQFPAPVGHRATDVTEQLGNRIELPSKRSVNSPVGFVKNFITYLRTATHNGTAKPIDVLGFYEAGDLPFFRFLVENYAYCERYYCSHPGPTLPNRMFTLAGNLQFTRSGEAIIENNHSADFFLSRAATFHDLLTRKGVGWRVYESPPSVAMLRMFARYAADNTNIVPISQLDRDIEVGLPPLTIIEPAMHHFPPNDDHPVADMCNGQNFLRGVYDKLSKGKQWKNTLLIITYDEHGGFYDHVIPPTADLRTHDGSVLSKAAKAIGTSTLLTPYGVRVPTFVVSPWVPSGHGPDIVLDHCSIAKTILACFCGDSQPFLSDRVHSSRSFDAFLTEAAPRLNVPPAPRITCAPPVDPKAAKGIVTPPMSRKQMRAGSVDYHDLTGMLARMLGRR